MKTLLLISLFYASSAMALSSPDQYSKAELQAMLDHKATGRNEIFWGELKSISYKATTKEGDKEFLVESFTQGGNTCATVTVRSREVEPDGSERSSGRVDAEVLGVSLPRKCAE